MEIINEWMDGEMENGLMDEWMEEGVDVGDQDTGRGQANSWMFGSLDKWKDATVNGWMDR